MRPRVFFPQASIDQWGVEGKIELSSDELVLVAEGRRYRITEAVRVLVEVTGAEDPHGIVGKVKPKAELEPMGAEILENSMILGDNAYDIVPGWAGTPETSFAEHLASEARRAARSAHPEAGSPPNSEEEMLARFAQGAL